MTITDDLGNCMIDKKYIMLKECYDSNDRKNYFTLQNS